MSQIGYRYVLSFITITLADGVIDCCHDDTLPSSSSFKSFIIHLTCVNIYIITSSRMMHLMTCIQYMVQYHGCDCVSMSGPRHSMSEGEPLGYTNIYIHPLCNFVCVWWLSVSFILKSILVMHITPRNAWCRSSLFFSLADLSTLYAHRQTRHCMIIIRWPEWPSKSTTQSHGFYVVPLMCWAYSHCVLCYHCLHVVSIATAAVLVHQCGGTSSSPVFWTAYQWWWTVKWLLLCCCWKKHTIIVISRIHVFVTSACI